MKVKVEDLEVNTPNEVTFCELTADSQSFVSLSIYCKPEQAAAILAFAREKGAVTYDNPTIMKIDDKGTWVLA